MSPAGPASRRTLRISGIAAALVVAVAAGVVAFGNSPPGRHAGTAAVGLGAGGQRPAFAVPAPVRLKASAAVTLWAPVRRAAIVRSGPATTKRRVGAIDLLTPEHTANLVAVVGRPERHGALWVPVRIPSLTRRNTGWVPRSALGGYQVVHTHLVIDRERFTAVLWRDGRRIFRARVGVGKAQSPTPRGSFYIRNRLTRFSSPFYGPLAFGTSARSRVLTDWPAGGFVGIHGTSEPGLIPGRISHGCIRLRNTDILTLGRLMPVGTPVTIR